MKKRIVLDGRMLGWTGIGRYTSELIQNLAKIDKINNYIVLLDPKDADKLGGLPANFVKKIVNIRPYGLQEQLVLPFILYGLNPDLVHFMHFTAPLLYFGRRVVTVHDLTLVRYKTHRGLGLKRLIFELKYWVMRFILRSAVMRANAVLTDTEWVKQDILNFYSRSVFHKLLESKITATLLSISPSATRVDDSQANIKIAEPFLLYVGNFYPNKNIPALLNAFERLLTARPYLRLVLVGPKDYFLEQIQLRIAKMGLNDSVIITGWISDADLARLYKKAALFVFPSLSEGFGMPPLEAMAAGTPVISSNATCLPEVLGVAAAYFDPCDARDMAAKIDVLLKSDGELDRLRKAGQDQVRLFSWRRTAEQTLAVYERAGTRD
jgi:glycosyltransferase involved in cell wall biosynthesis